jgi:hypothetical protein
MISNNKHFAPILMLLMVTLFVRTLLASSKIMVNLKELNQTFREADYIHYDKLMGEILNSFKAQLKSDKIAAITPQEELMFRLAFNMAMHKRKIIEQGMKKNSWFLRQGR